MARLDEIRLQVRRSLIPGLFETESHFALYPPGHPLRLGRGRLPGR